MPYAVECRLRMRDGSYRLFRVRAMPQRDERGPDPALVRDQRGRPRPGAGRARRRDVEERYRLAAQATNDAIWDHDFIARHDRLERQCRGDRRLRQRRSGRTPACLVDGAHPSRREAEPGRKASTEAIEGDARAAGRGPTASAGTTAAMPTCSIAASSSATPRARRSARSARWPISPSGIAPRPRSAGCRPS